MLKACRSPRAAYGRGVAVGQRPPPDLERAGRGVVPDRHQRAGRAVRAVKVQYQQSLAQLRALELTVAPTSPTRRLTVESAFQQVQAAAASRELSQKRLEAEQSKFEVGMSYNYNVVLAQRDFTDAQNTELRAILNYRKALVDFQRKQETAAR